MLTLALIACRSETLAEACARCKADDCAPADATACREVGQAARNADPVELATALDRYGRACDAGDGPACSALGLLHEDGLGTPDDDQGALRLHDKACELGAGVGCFNAGLMYAAGHGVDRDRAKADAYFTRAEAAYRVSCDAGDLGWCLNLGVLYEDGYGVPQDAAKAADIYRAACDGGHLDSCVNLGLMEVNGRGVPTDLAGGTARIDRACAAGSALACGVEGQLATAGQHGLAVDAAKGIPLLERGCAGGVAQACGVLGAVLGMGELVPADPGRADVLERRACDLGASDGCYVTAMDPRLPPAEANAWLRRACGMGNDQACAELGGRLVDSSLGTLDFEGAIAAWTAGCRMGSIDACAPLASVGLPLPIPAEDRPNVLAQLCTGGVSQACPPSP
jgi:TPR repeat protein